MSESEPTPLTPTPSSAAAAGSSSSDSTPSARAGLKDAKPRPPVVGRMVYVVAVVTLLWVAALTIPMSNGFLYGGASGASAMMLVYVALIVAKRRGYDTFFVRELEKRGDERDRAASQRAWALTGVVGFFGNVRNVGGDASEGAGVRCRFNGLTVGLSFGLAGLQELLCVGSTDGRAQGSPHASRCFFGHGLAFYRE